MGYYIASARKQNQVTPHTLHIKKDNSPIKKHYVDYQVEYVCWLDEFLVHEHIV